MTAALDAAPGDTGLMLRWVALASGRKEHAGRSVELLEQLAAAAPKDLELQKLRVEALIGADRPAEALPLVEALLERLDRERARQSDGREWERASAISSLRQRRAKLVRDIAGPAEALAVSLDRLGERYASSDRYSRDDTPLQARRLDAMVELGLDDEFRAALASLPRSALATLDWSIGQRYRLVRKRSGEGEAVAEELFQRTFNAIKSPFDAANSSDYDVDVYSEMYGPRQAQMSAFAQELVMFAHEDGRLAELRERVAALGAERPEDPQVPLVLRAIDDRLAADRGENVAARQRAEERERALAAAEKRVEQDPHDPQRVVALAQERLYAGDAAGALVLLQRAEPIVRGRAYSTLQEYVVMRQEYGAPKGGVRFRFATSSGTSSGTGYSSWSQSSGDAQQQHLRLLAASYFATGAREEGLAVEARLDRLGATSEGGWTYDPFTQTWSQGSPLLGLYAGLGLGAEVDRLAEAELAKIARECEGDPKRERERRRQLADQVLSGLALHANRPAREAEPDGEARRARWVAARQALWLEDLAEADDEDDRLVAELQYRAWLSDVAKDEAAALELAREVVARPAWRERDPSTSSAWLLLMAGDFDAARAMFEALLAERKTPPPVARYDELEVGLACCRVLAGEADVPLEELRRAHAAGYSSPNIRAALGLPPLP